MQTRSESLSLWLGISILVHGFVFVVWADRAFQAPSVSQPAGVTTTRVALRLVKPAPAPAPTTPAAPAPVPTAKPAPREPAAAPPPPEPARPVRQSTAPPKPAEAAPPLPVVPPEPIAPPEEPVTDAAPDRVAATDAPAAEADALPSSASPSSGLPAVSADPPSESEAVDLLPSYVAEVRARIEQQKRYPAMARRRGDEGVVLARVAIGPDGDLDSIDLEGRASPFLLRATREAVERARPFPMPPRGAVTIEVPVRWQVRR